MNMVTIDVNRVEQLLDSYWKKWEPYEYEKLIKIYNKTKSNILGDI